MCQLNSQTPPAAGVLVERAGPVHFDSTGTCAGYAMLWKTQLEGKDQRGLFSSHTKANATSGQIIHPPKGIVPSN